MEAISEFLRRHDVPTSFDEIYSGLKPDLKEMWGQRVIPSGTEHISSEVYEAALSVHRAEVQRRFNEAFRHSGAEALLFPTTPCTAPLIEYQWKFKIADQEGQLPGSGEANSSRKWSGFARHQRSHGSLW